MSKDNERRHIVDNEKIDIGTRARPLAIDLGLQQLGKQSNKWEEMEQNWECEK